MPKQIPWQQRYPDYGIPYSLIQHNSWAERVLGYAFFVNKVRPTGSFSYEDYCSFRIAMVPRKQSFTDAVKKLVSMGFIQQLSDGTYKITTKGTDGNIRISKRNAGRRSLRGDD